MTRIPTVFSSCSKARSDTTSVLSIQERSQEEYRTYWEAIVSLYDIRFEYDIIAIEGEIACIHWQNWYRDSPEGKLDHVDGVFIVTFNAAGSCEQFRQWWFMEK